MNTNELIKRRRKELRLTMREVADSVGVSEATVSRWESGNIANMGRDKIALLAKILKISPSQIAGYEEDTLKHPEITEDIVTFPVIGEIAAGYDQIAIEDWSGETVDIPISYLKGRKKEDFFVLSVKGDSMYPLYMDGDKVLILRQTTLNHSGEIGAILYDDDNATLKRVEYVKGEDWLRMIPVNPEYQPKKIEGADLERCRVIGIPKLLIRDIES